MTMHERIGSLRMSRRQAVVSATAGTVMAAGAARVFAQDATPTATPVAGVTPASVSAAIDQIPALAEELLDHTGIPGIAISVVYQDEVRFADGFGLREAGAELAVDGDTVFQLASVSKAVGSTVVAAVVGEGQVTWDTRIADLDSSFVLSDPWVTANVTIADLYSHRSGLPDHAGDTLEDLGGDRELVLHNLRYLKRLGSFRNSYAYTNFGLTAAAQAVATHVGTTWEDLSNDKLYAPAGMTSTSSRYSDFAARDNRAVNHVEQDGAWVHAFDRQPDAQSPAGGVSSTARDLGQWLRLQLGGGALDGEQLVDAAALGVTHLPHAMNRVPADPLAAAPGWYALGWNVRYGEDGLVEASHSGAFALGAGTCVFIRPRDQLGIVVLTNAFPIGAAESLAFSFLDLCRFGAVQHDYLPILGPIVTASAAPEYGEGVAEAPERVDPPSAPEAYLGVYENDFFGDLEVVQDGERLALRLGPNAALLPMAHYTRDVYTYLPVGENGGITSAVTFTIGADGVASQVVLENLDLYGAGTFIRPAAEA